MVANTATVATATAPAKAPVLPAPAPTRYIALLVPANPKKPASASVGRFALYSTGQTVAAFTQAVIKAGFARKYATADLLWDQRHGFISLHTTAEQAAKAEQAAATARKAAMAASLKA